MFFFGKNVISMVNDVDSLGHKSFFIDVTMWNRFAHENLPLRFFYGKKTVKLWNR